MAELHSMSMAYTSSSHHTSSLGWDCHNHLGLLNTDRMSIGAAMDDQSYMMINAPPLYSPLADHSDFSTGYLEDALVEFSERSKRRRLLSYTHNDNEIKESSTALLPKRYWNSDWEMSENFDCMSQLTTSSGLSVLLGDPASITSPLSRISEETTIFGKINTPPDQESADPEAIDSSSSSSYKESTNTNSDYLPAHKETLLSKIAQTVAGSGDQEKKKKKKRDITRRMVYPFALVKPGGVEGDMTLNDINERILMPPTRPVRHPVGDFACRPCVSPDGPGLSGKAVVALTRIQTQGRGTITIIRTKG